MAFNLEITTTNRKKLTKIEVVFSPSQSQHKSYIEQIMLIKLTYFIFLLSVCFSDLCGLYITLLQLCRNKDLI